MYHETVTDLDEPPLNGKHPDTYFGDAGRGKNSRAEEIIYDSASASFPTWVKPVSDSDSVDSQFNTQHEAQPVRNARRQRPEANAPNPLTAGEPYWENVESGSPHGPREAPLKPRKSHKASRQRQRRHIYKRLTQRKTLTCELAALGGFFKRVMEMKVSKRRNKRYFKHTKRCMSPLCDSDEGQDNEGIKIVDLRDFIPEYKIARKGYLPWLNRNDPVDIVTEETKDVPVTQSISDSCSGSLASDNEAGCGESERSKSEAERQPVPYHSSGRVSSCMAEALDSCFRRDETQPMARSASNPGSEMATGVENLRTMRKCAVRLQRAAVERPPQATLSQAGVSEEEARTEHLPVSQTQDKKHCSRVSGGEHSFLNFTVLEPVGDTVSSVAICEERIRKKKKKKRKKDNSRNVEEYISESPCETLSDSLHL